MDFGRIMTAMVTPFTEDLKVDYKAAIKLANFLVDTGTDTVLLAGTTGESPTLTHEEEYDLFELVLKAVKGRAKVMVGAGSNATDTAVSTTKFAEKTGVDGVMHVVPYYNKPSQEGQYQHFKAIAEATDLPIMIYNIPGRTAVNMQPETVARLVNDFDNIVCIKETVGVEQVKAIRALTPESFRIYSGDDSNTLPFMREGAYGVVSVAAHCAGNMIKDMINAFVAGDHDKANALNDQLMPLFETLFITSNPTPVKAALNMMGLQVGGLRLPMIEANAEEKKQIESVLESLQILKNV